MQNVSNEDEIISYIYLSNFGKEKVRIATDLKLYHIFTFSNFGKEKVRIATDLKLYHIFTFSNFGNEKVRIATDFRPEMRHLTAPELSAANSMSVRKTGLACFGFILAHCAALQKKRYISQCRRFLFWGAIDGVDILT